VIALDKMMGLQQKNSIELTKELLKELTKDLTKESAKELCYLEYESAERMKRLVTAMGKLMELQKTHSMELTREVLKELMKDLRNSLIKLNKLLARNLESAME
jgi:protein required for attachment to host cells